MNCRNMKESEGVRSSAFLYDNVYNSSPYVASAKPNMFLTRMTEDKSGVSFQSPKSNHAHQRMTSDRFHMSMISPNNRNLSINHELINAANSSMEIRRNQAEEDPYQKRLLTSCIKNRPLTSSGRTDSRRLYQTMNRTRNSMNKLDQNEGSIDNARNNSCVSGNVRSIISMPNYQDVLSRSPPKYYSNLLIPSVVKSSSITMPIACTMRPHARN